MIDHERLILGHLIMRPELLKISDNLVSGFFEDKRYRKVFGLINEIFEDSRPEMIDLRILADKFGGDGVAPFVSGLIDGLQKITPEGFLRLINEAKKEKIKHKISQQNESDARLIIKTGDFDHLPCKSLYDEYDQLCQPDDGQDDFMFLSSVEPVSVPWLWPNFIPLGRATLISGDPGVGKSWLGLDLAARLSRGLPWPDGSPGIEPARTYYLTVEDQSADTVRPRMDILHGDPGQIAVIKSENSPYLDLSAPAGLQRLECNLNKIGNVRLLVIDPILDFSGGINPNAGEEVRALLGPLVALASKMNLALVLIGHLNKSQALSAIYRAGGSTSGWLGKCRAAFMIFRDLDDKTLRHVVPMKSNLSPVDPPQLEFHLEPGRLNIHISREEVNIDEHLNPQPGRRPREKDAARDWLDKLFAVRDEIPVGELETLAHEKNFSFRTLRRAKHDGGYVSRRRNMPDGLEAWYWAKGQGGQDVL